ncbi:MAG: DUF4352 domain-containing protein [Oscillospiraceae bacterium]|nr:DUF4352 domain-containing protein [Oscillospiraceae bacterium]
MDENNYKQLVISRKSKVTGSAIKHKVYLDGRPVGDLKNGGTVETWTTDGLHSLSFVNDKKEVHAQVRIMETDTVYRVNVEMKSPSNLEVTDGALENSVQKSSKSNRGSCLTSFVAVLLILIIAGFIIAIVNSNSSDDSSSKSNSENSVSTSSTESEDDVVEEEPTFDTETKTVGDWKVTITDVEVLDKLNIGILSYTPDEGCKYVKISLTIKNNSESLEYFQGYSTNSKIVYDGKYEYSATITGMSDDLTYESLNPLVTVSGYLLFSVPEEVIESEDSLYYVVTSGSHSAEFLLW